MKTRSRAAALFVGSILSLTTVFRADAQEAEKRPPFGEGTHALRAILNKLKLEPIKSEKQFRDEVDDGNADGILMIVLGDVRVLQRTLGANGLKAFLQNGGAVLIATDRMGQNWPPVFGQRTQVSGGFVEASQPRSMYRESRECPFVRPLPSKMVPVLDGLSRVATNRPSFLHLDSASPLSTLAVFPGDCTIEGIPLVLMRQLHPNQLPFAAGGSIGAGRALLFADHSIFINDMLLQTDNDNFDLACSAVRWLSEDGKRSRVLFVEEGDVVSNFNVILKEAPLPPLPPLPPEAEMVRLANQLLTDLEREDYFNRTLLEAISPAGRVADEGPDIEVGRGRLLQALLVVLTVGLLLFGCHRLMRARHRLDARVPAPGPELWPASAGAVIEQRQRALLQIGNLWEPARALVRQFFEGAADLRPEQWVAAAPLPPRLTVSDAAQRRGLEKQVRELWRLAVSAGPRRISPIDFERLLARVRALQANLAAGALKFSPA